MEWPALPLIFGLSKARRRSSTLYGSVSEEQRRSGQKAAQPSGGSRLGRLAAFLARLSRHGGTDMRLARALPSAPTCIRADHPSISTVSVRCSGGWHNGFSAVQELTTLFKNLTDRANRDSAWHSRRKNFAGRAHSVAVGVPLVSSRIRKTRRRMFERKRSESSIMAQIMLKFGHDL